MFANSRVSTKNQPDAGLALPLSYHLLRIYQLPSKQARRTGDGMIQHHDVVTQNSHLSADSRPTA